MPAAGAHWRLPMPTTGAYLHMPKPAAAAFKHTPTMLRWRAQSLLPARHSGHAKAAMSACTHEKRVDTPVQIWAPGPSPRTAPRPPSRNAGRCTSSSGACGICEGNSRLTQACTCKHPDPDVLREQELNCVCVIGSKQGPCACKIMAISYRSYLITQTMCTLTHAGIHTQARFSCRPNSITNTCRPLPSIFYEGTNLEPFMGAGMLAA